jgi:hypothetical protein
MSDASDESSNYEFKAKEYTTKEEQVFEDQCKPRVECVVIFLELDQS